MARSTEAIKYEIKLGYMMAKVAELVVQVSKYFV